MDRPPSTSHRRPSLDPKRRGAIALLALSLAPLSLAALTSTGCDKLLKKDKEKTSHADDDDDDDDAPRKKKKAKGEPSSDASASAAAAPSASAPAPAGGNGPSVTIPAGTLRAGHACGGVPRVTDEELVWPSVPMSEFSIDVYPYPNDPSQAARTGVTQAEASSLCQARGKRLCTELEWERACKGSDNKTFEYGSQYNKDACKPLATNMPDARAKCVSDVGVKDMHGLVFEWTSSDWGRGKSGLATVRGSSGASNIVHERCAAGEGRAPGTSSNDIGFRCCAGPTNPAVVDLKLEKQAPLTEDPSVDATLAANMLKAMPKDHQSVDNATVKFDKIWRWHPRDNEELIVGRWVGRSNKGTTWAELAVFKVCGDTPARIANMPGPVGKVGDPTVGTNLEKATASGDTKTDSGKITLSYWYGSVKIEAPPFVKPGNSLPDDASAPAIRPSVKVRPQIKVGR